MLIDILREIGSANTHSYSSLAKALNLDLEMVKQMFYNLQNLGYIISDDPACGDDRCDECGVCCTKKRDKGNKEANQAKNATRWRLTEKGKKAIIGDNS